MNNDLIFVMYHYVREVQKSKYPNIKGLETTGFVRQLDYLNANFNPENSSTIISWMSGR